jgi:hypothetical protein
MTFPTALFLALPALFAPSSSAVPLLTPIHSDSLTTRSGGSGHGGGYPKGGCGNLHGKIYFAPRADVTITLQSGLMTRCHGPKERYTVKKEDMGGVRWHTQNGVVDTDVR